jgi:hypothetical protein
MMTSLGLTANGRVVANAGEAGIRGEWLKNVDGADSRALKLAALPGSQAALRVSTMFSVRRLRDGEIGESGGSRHVRHVFPGQV